MIETDTYFSKILDNRRFDPIYYNLVFSAFQYFPFVALKSFCLNFQSGFGAGKDDQAIEKNGIIQIRPTNIDNQGMLKYDKNIFVPASLNKTFLEFGDVLFNNTNSQELVGKTAVFKEDRKLFFSNHITRIKVDKTKAIPDYLWIILNIYQKRDIFYSICTNWNNQSGVGIELLKSLKVPLPPIDIQQKIVDFYNDAVREKHAKEQEAKTLLDSIDGYLLKELGIELPENTANERYFEVNISKLIGNRLDPIFFNLDISKFQNNFPLVALKSFCIDFQSGFGIGKEEQATEENGTIQIRPTNIDSDGSLKYDKNIFVPASSNKTLLHVDDILFNNTNSQELVGKTAILKEERTLFFSNHITRIKVDKMKANPDYLWIILNFYQKRNVFYSICTNWNNQSGIGIDLLKTIKIPFPPIEKQNEIAENIKSIRAKAKQLQKEAGEVLEKAKREVEEMIRGGNQ